MYKILLLKCCFLLFLNGTLCSQQLNRAARPNVLFICVDDLRPDLGCYGNSKVKTPNIDRLAGSGMVFDRVYCQQSLCAPSRASMMTGMRPDTLPIPREDVHFRSVLPDLITLPQLFKQAGYHAQAFGKVYHAYPPQPDDISWTVPERLLDIPKRDEYLLPENRVRGFINPMEKGSSSEAIDVPDDAYQDGQVATAAIETLDTIKQKPFFLALGFKRPHLPFTAPKKYWDLYQRNELELPASFGGAIDTGFVSQLRFDWQWNKGEMRNYTDIPAQGNLTREKATELLHAYYACVSFIDAQIGRVLHAIDSMGLREKTIVVLWSDNGYKLGERNSWGKKDNDERSTKVVLIIDAPGTTVKATRTSSLVELVDIYPTLAELCQLKAPDQIQGLSMVPVLKNPKLPWKKAVFSSFPRMNQTVMTYTVRTTKYRYHEYRETRSGKMIAQQLYDMDNDPLEYKDLSTDKSMRLILAEHQQLLNSGWRSALPESITQNKNN